MGEKYRIGSAEGNVQIGDGNEMSVSGPTTVGGGTASADDVVAAITELARQVAAGQEAIREIEADMAELREELARPQPRQARVTRLLRALSSSAAEVGTIAAAVAGVQQVIDQV